MNVYLDNSIINNLLDLEESRRDLKWEENRKYLKRLRDGPMASGDMTFFVNPTVISQIQATKSPERRKALLDIVDQFRFTEFNMTIFPFSFPARFLSTEQKNNIRQLCVEHPSLEKDQKILADAAFNENIDVLLTTDDDLPRKVPQIGKVKVMRPKQLWEFCGLCGTP